MPIYLCVCVLCYVDVTQGLCRCYADVKQVLYRCYTGVIQMLHWGFADVIQRLCRCYANVTQVLPRCYSGGVLVLCRSINSLLKSMPPKHSLVKCEASLASVLQINLSVSPRDTFLHVRVITAY